MNNLVREKSKMPYYAVKKGLVPGVYLTWKECEKQVKGIKYASYRKFNTIEEAREFAGVEKSSFEEMEESTAEKNVEDTKIKNSRTYHLWTDGSSDQSTYASYGFVLVRNDQILYSGNGLLKEPFTSAHGEVGGLFEGMTYVLKNFPEDIKNDLEVFCDSQFAVKTLNEEYGHRTEKDWKKKAYAEEFQEMLRWKEQHGIKFTHVNSHIGLKYNELADQLANDARRNVNASESDSASTSNSTDEDVFDVKVTYLYMTEPEISLYTKFFVIPFRGTYRTFVGKTLKLGCESSSNSLLDGEIETSDEGLYIHLLTNKALEYLGKPEKTVEFEIDEDMEDEVRKLEHDFIVKVVDGGELTFKPVRVSKSLIRAMRSIL